MRALAMNILAILLALSSAGLAHAKDMQSTIPKPFHGDWSLSAAQCAPGPADGGNMRITAKRIYSFESQIRIKQVRVLAPNSIEYASRVSHSGAEYGDLSRLTLSDDGTLFVGDGEDRAVFVRCKS
jgi:hypothetical protein